MWSTRGTQLAMGDRNICAAPCRFPLWFSIGNAQAAHGAQMTLPPVARRVLAITELLLLHSRRLIFHLMSAAGMLTQRGQGAHECYGLAPSSR